MSSLGSLQHHEVHVWQVNLDDAVLDRFAGVLSRDERDKAQRYRTQVLQNRYARCRSALRLVLARYANQAAAELHFQYGEFGKPELPHHRLHFNVTHSGGLALIAVSLQEVGIDLESLERADADLPGLIDLVCHNEEKANLARLPDGERSALFRRIWTRKEAYCKMRGIGLQQTLSALRLEANPDQTMFSVHVGDGGRIPDAFAKSYVYPLHVADSHAASVCLPTDEGRVVMCHG